MAVYGLEVPAGDVPIPAVPDFPASFQITMAAIDPSAMPEGEPSETPRATLKILRAPIGADDDEDEDDFDPDEMDRILAGEDSGEDDSEEDSEDDEDAAGPSDPAKSKKARKAAAMEAIKKLLEQDEMDVDEAKSGLNGKGKGKAPVSDDDEEDSEDDDEDDDEDEEIEEFVLCTLDPKSHYQQPLNLTIGENERVYFQVSGTHSVFLTGNYVEPDHTHDDEDDEDDDEYDLSPDEEDYDEEYDSEDDLDGMEDPRITEIDDEEEAPKLVEAKKGKNKRAADDETLDTLISESKAEPTANGEKLSKKQLKKMKKNDGTAIVAEQTEEAPSSTKSDKKVQFAKNLEQGPTPSGDKPTGTLGVKEVRGVKIDDKKLGKGVAARSGNTVAMRYIGKLEDGKVFDSNKKGKPFSFKLGKGEVIKGWDIGVAGMAVGGERRISIPPALAYGKKALPGIPANSKLIFDVKLLEIK